MTRRLPIGRHFIKEVIKVSTNFFSSLNGKFDLNSSMSSLYGDYNQIKSGAYGSLMKSYVNKVGNKSALKAYQETGSTTTAADSSSTGSVSTTSKKSSASKSNFLDSHFSNIKNSGTYTKSDLLAKIKNEESKTQAAASETAAGTNVDTTI
jgi:hypothetical protein